MVINQLKSIMLTRGHLGEGDLEQFKKDYEASRDFVRFSIFHMVRSDVVDDLVQDTYVKAWTSYKKFNHQSSFKTWIYRIAMNVTYDYLRKNKRTISSEVETEYLDKNDIKDLITKGLMQLSEKHREVFILYYKLEYSLVEISKLLKIAEGTVKSRAHYAKNEFVAFLKENGVEHG